MLLSSTFGPVPTSFSQSSLNANRSPSVAFSKQSIGNSKKFLAHFSISSNLLLLRLRGGVAPQTIPASSYHSLRSIPSEKFRPGYLEGKFSAPFKAGSIFERSENILYFSTQRVFDDNGDDDHVAKSENAAQNHSEASIGSSGSKKESRIFMQSFLIFDFFFF